ncbi:hypothetical protein GQ53DRAFT_782152 [Thozetella sp. PMI_491]|nr:hypothetical protein GQ53DRAFT_782152 [Thozetella sp. PMI_491]
MVSFSCEACGDVFTKKKLDPHRNRCRGATFTCIDCMVHFPGTEYRSHTSCMTEEQKYQGALYKNKKQKTSQTIEPNQPSQPTQPKTPAPRQKNMAQPAYVEDYVDEFDEWRDYEVDSEDDDDQSADLPPEAPTPPSATNADGHVNVFDFLVANATPAASNVNLPQGGAVQLSEDTQLVRFDHEANAVLELLDNEDEDGMVQYGSGPVPTNFETPAPKAARKKTKDGDKEVKKDKKRKRLHIETDQIMTDAPPVLHSGLTGGLSRMMSRPGAFPPSPDYSGGDADQTPASPLKKTKHSKHSKGGIGNSIMAMIAPPNKTKSKKKKHVASTSTTKKPRARIEAPKEQKLLEYRPGSKDKDAKDGQPSSQMVLYKPRAEHFLSFVNKGPESERGCSMNKALKRFHRERSDSNNSLSKLMEEKELWRSLRMRKNDRGEIVLFCI